MAASANPIHESTISDIEQAVQNGLEALRNAPLSDQITAALKFLTPPGYRPIAQLEEDGRKKRSTAAAWNWNPATGSILIYFEPISSEPVTNVPVTPLNIHPLGESPRLGVMTLKIDEARERYEKEDPAWGDREPSDRNALSLTRMDQLVNEAAAQEATPLQIQECCIALAEAEKAGKAFIALRWFRDDELPKHKFDWTGTQESRQIVLTKAIEIGAIQTSRIPNPRAPQHPTTTVKLNRESKFAQAAAPRFQPIQLRGEGPSASEIVIRDRGRF